MMEEFMLTPKDKQDARIALLKYYSSECVAHSAYLVAIAVGFFAFVEATPLMTGVDLLPLISDLARSILASLMLSVFIILFIYVLGRTFFWGYLTTAILSMRPKGESEVKFEAERTIVTYIQRLHVACIDYLKEKHRWSAIFYTLRISTLALIWFYMFVAFSIISLALLYLP